MEVNQLFETENLPASPRGAKWVSTGARRSKLRACRAQLGRKHGCCTWRESGDRVVVYGTTRACRRRRHRVSLETTPMQVVVVLYGLRRRCRALHRVRSERRYLGRSDFVWLETRISRSKFRLYDQSNKEDLSADVAKSWISQSEGQSGCPVQYGRPYAILMTRRCPSVPFGAH